MYIPAAVRVKPVILIMRTKESGKSTPHNTGKTCQQKSHTGKN